MSEVDETAVNAAGIIRGGALVVSVLGAEAPAASLPQGTVFDDVTRGVVVALETVGELDLSSPASLAKYSTVFKTFFSFFDVGWTLGGEDAWDPIITGGKEESGGGRGTCSKKVLLKAGADSTGSKMSFHYK